MISQHTLAREMVTREKNEVFDDRCLDLIERFISDPSRKDAMMNEYGWCDEEGQKPGMLILIWGFSVQTMSLS